MTQQQQFEQNCISSDEFRTQLFCYICVASECQWQYLCRECIRELNPAFPYRLPRSRSDWHVSVLACSLHISICLVAFPLYLRNVPSFRIKDADGKSTFYTTLHYTTLHYTTLHYTTLHYTTLHYTTLHYTTLH